MKIGAPRGAPQKNFEIFSFFKFRFSFACYPKATKGEDPEIKEANMKHLTAIFALILALALLFSLAACSGEEQTSAVTDGTETVDETETTETPADAATDETGSETTDETGDETPAVTTTPFAIATTVENGYTVTTDGDETVYTFTVAGEYTVTGDLVGRLVFADTLDTKVTLNLAGCTITSAKTAIYWAAESKKVEIVVAEGTENTVTTTASGEDTYNTIASENNIDVKGAGTLTVAGGQNHAIKGSDVEISDTVILHITAVHDGIHAKSVVIDGGTITISECSDGIDAERNSKGKKGTVEITGGTITVTACTTAIQAESALTVSGGAVTVTNCETAIDAPAENIAAGTVTVNGTAYTPAAE